jgi:hypothetical protein
MITVLSNINMEHSNGNNNGAIHFSNRFIFGVFVLVFRNTFPKWIYLCAHNDKIEALDASHLKGKGALETDDLIRKNAKRLKQIFGGEQWK